jgi:hypothetical protein
MVWRAAFHMDNAHGAYLRTIKDDDLRVLRLSALLLLKDDDLQVHTEKISTSQWFVP